MLKIRAKKVNMSQSFLENGRVIPITFLSFDRDNTDSFSNLLHKIVSISGVSKGKGFTGVMKKWNFSGQQATRGQSDRPRAAGSIGAQTPGRVFKGKKMAGRHGSKTVSLKNIKIMSVDLEKNILSVSGPVPGSRNSEVIITYEGVLNS
jgi:large subunit ribosomal protein L3